MNLPLPLGPLAVPGHRVRRSGLRWLRSDGERCRAGDIVAYCGLGIVPHPPRPFAEWPFADEGRELQLAFALRCDGTLRRRAGASRGGFDDLHFYRGEFWDPSFSIGTLEIEGSRPLRDDVRAAPLRTMFAAGRRGAEPAEDRSGFLTGWLDRSRAWWHGEGGSPRHATLLSAGICELQGVMRGEQVAFQEWFDASRGPAEVVLVPDHLIVPSAPLLVEQASRTPHETQAMIDDFARSFPAASPPPAASAWLFASALMNALSRSPLTETRERVGPAGLERSSGADAVVLSLNAESRVLARHRRLGYVFNCHGHRIQEAGPAVASWLARDFEPLRRSIDDIRRDLERLIDTTTARSRTAFLVVNRISSTGHEDLHEYAAFERPLGDQLVSVDAKDMNLMLHDLARGRDLSIVDHDAIAASMGAAHIADGVHGSGPLQDEVRSEILRILRMRGLAGFAPRDGRGA